MKVALWATIAFIVLCLVVTFPWGKVSPLPFLMTFLAVVISVVIPILLGRKRISFMVVWFAAYLVTYAALSWKGEYIDANHGGSDNRSYWYPAYCGEAYWSRMGRQKSALLPLGWFFLPLVLTDRWFIHPSKEI